MKEIVWVCGGAAAGKETFIHRVTAGKEPAICDQFDWGPNLPAVCVSSLEYVGRFPGDDEMVNKRSNIIEEVAQLAPSNDVVLIKEQRVDLRAGRPEILKEIYPNAIHTLLVLECVDSHERMQRYASKPFAKSDATIDDLKNNFDMSLEMLAQLKNFKVYAIDSSSDGNYKTIELPSVFI